MGLRRLELALKRDTCVGQSVYGRLQAVDRRLRVGKADIEDRAREVFEDCRDRCLLGFEAHLLLGQDHESLSSLIKRRPESDQLRRLRSFSAIAITGREREGHDPETDAALGRAAVLFLNGVKKLAQDTALFLMFSAEGVQETVLSRGH